jgi:O-antigen/teichoic acid export membrane protein
MSGKLAVNAGLYVAISLVTQGVTFLFWIVIAWWFSPSLIGLYTLVLFIVELYSAVAVFGQDAALTRFYYTSSRKDDVLKNALIIVLSGAIAAIIFFMATVKTIPQLIPGLHNFFPENTILAATVIFGNSLANLVSVHYAAMKKVLLYGLYQGIKLLIFCFLSVLFIYFGMSVEGLLKATAISSFTIILLFVFCERKEILKAVVSFPLAKEMIIYGLPLMLYAAFGIFITYFGRVLLASYVNLAILGVYSFFLTITLQVNGFWGSVNRAWTPELFSRISRQKSTALESAKTFSYVFVFLYLAGFTILVLIGESFLFSWLFKPVYLDKVNLFYILLLGPIFTGIYTAFYPFYYYENKTTLILFISIFLSGLQILVSIIFIKYWSDTGAAFSFYLMSSISTISYIFFFRRQIENFQEQLRFLFILVLLTLVSVVTLLVTSSYLLFALAISVTTIAIFVIARPYITDFFVNAANTLKRGKVSL